MSVSPFDHPLLGGLLGDGELGPLFEASAEIHAMLAFETALAAAEAEAGVIPQEAGRAIAAALSTFEFDMCALRDGATRDGVVVPELVGQLRRAVGEPHARHVHFGATSQDVVDTGLALRLAVAMDVIVGRIEELCGALDRLSARDGSLEVMAHTRMQAAIPVPAARKIASWRDPLARHLERAGGVRAGVCILSFGGAAGTLDKLGGRGGAVASRLGALLELGVPERARHSERDGIVALGGWLALVTGSLGKIGQDIALLAQSETGEVKLESGGGSSAMPHKVNPVAAEVLVALARFTAALGAGMNHALVHENERSGAAWTLEWMLLPQMVVATGAALTTATRLVAGIGFVARGSGR